jgi:alkanesulfonate monooxygenase SsuD/methylene tetrahydromethanopterin reductase-like flavin-dependent oxidoreductase (luciferase family)
VRVGLTLPSFVEDPEIVCRVAASADEAGLDAVFVYDHLFRVGKNGDWRPALECLALLGAVAGVTTNISIGPLVARATLRPPAVLAAGLDTAHRISGGRVIAAIGSGDRESRVEMEAFGYEFGDEAHRVEALYGAVRGTRGRGYPVWVGGTSSAVRALAVVDADGWNRWGGTPARLVHDVASLGPLPDGFTISWGGLVVIDDTDAAAAEKAQRLDAGPHVLVGGPETIAEAFAAYRVAGAEMVIAGPLDSEDPANAPRLARVKELLAG